MVQLADMPGTELSRIKSEIGEKLNRADANTRFEYLKGTFRFLFQEYGFGDKNEVLMNLLQDLFHILRDITKFKEFVTTYLPNVLADPNHDLAEISQAKKILRAQIVNILKSRTNGEG